jgi:hypothetical protein
VPKIDHRKNLTGLDRRPESGAQGQALPAEAEQRYYAMLEQSAMAA